MPLSRFCKSCIGRCCKFVYPMDGLFLTSNERDLFEQHLNSKNSAVLSLEKEGEMFGAELIGFCPFQSLKNPFLCKIWKKRPADCRLYPIYIFPKRKILELDATCLKVSRIVETLKNPEKYNGHDVIRYIKGIGSYMDANNTHADLLFDFARSLPETVPMDWDAWVRISESVQGEIAVI